MKRLLIISVLLIVACWICATCLHGAVPTFESFSDQFQTNNLRLYLRATHTNDAGIVYPALLNTLTLVTNENIYGTFSIPTKVTLLALGTNELDMSVETSWLLNSPTNDASQVILSLSAGAYQGQFAYINSQNGGNGFTLPDMSEQYDVPGAYVDINGDWIGITNRGIILRYVAPDWVEQSRFDPSSGGGGSVLGGGTSPFIPYWSGATTLSNSPLYRVDASNVGITSGGVNAQFGVSSGLTVISGTSGIEWIAGSGVLLMVGTSYIAPSSGTVGIPLGFNTNYFGALILGTNGLKGDYTDNGTQLLRNGVPVGGAGAALWATSGGVISPNPAVDVVSIKSQLADNATNSALVVDTASAWTTGALAEFKNQGTNRFISRADGSINFAGGLLGGTLVTNSIPWYAEYSMTDLPITFNSVVNATITPAAGTTIAFEVDLNATSIDPTATDLGLNAGYFANNIPSYGGRGFLSGVSGSIGLTGRSLAFNSTNGVAIGLLGESDGTGNDYSVGVVGSGHLSAADTIATPVVIGVSGQAKGHAAVPGSILVGGYFMTQTNTTISDPVVPNSVIVADDKNGRMPVFVGQVAETTMTTLNPGVVSTGSAVAYTFDTSNDLTTGDKLATFANHGTNKMYLTAEGTLTLGRAPPWWGAFSPSLLLFSNTDHGYSGAWEIFAGGGSDVSGTNYSFDAVGNNTQAATIVGSTTNYVNTYANNASTSNAGIEISNQGTKRTFITPSIASGSGSSAYYLDTQNSLAATESLLTVLNHGTNKFSISNLGAITIAGTTNQVTFGATNTAPASAVAPTKWISVKVAGDSGVYRIPLYE